MTLPELLLTETIASLLDDYARYVQGDPSGLPKHVVQARLMAEIDEQAYALWFENLEQHTTAQPEEP